MCRTFSFPHSTNHSSFYWSCCYQNAMILLIKSWRIIVLHKRPDLRKFATLIVWKNAVPLLFPAARGAHCKRKFSHPLSPASFTIHLSYLLFFPFFCGYFVPTGMRSTLLQWQLASGFCASPIWKPVGRPAFSWTKNHTSGDWRYRGKPQTNLLQQLYAGGSSLFKRERLEKH